MRRSILLVVAALAAVTIATGSLAYTSVDAGRGVNVAVASDENAYLGLTEPTAECRVLPEEAAETAKSNTESCDDAAVLRVTNQFASEMTVAGVSVDGPDGGGVNLSSAGLTAGDTIGIGSERTLRVDGSEVCTPEQGASETVELSITLSVQTDDGTEAKRFDKSVKLECSRSGSSETGDDGESPVEFNGCGSVDPADDADVTIQTRVYYKSNGNDAGYHTKRKSGKLVGVVLDDGRAFTNGNYDFGSDNCGSKSDRGEGVQTDSPPWDGRLSDEESAGSEPPGDSESGTDGDDSGAE
ncbi:hypothetical protein BRD16_09670 [Halobacteriales archaeon SW_6_65_46]|nr:MAG: hypothetical protein BRD16_09670 [Halobacteriales archaeon SW_6_65_46]